MLIRFNVGNFLSFSEIQEFSMIAGKVRSKSNRLYMDDSIKLLKVAAIFGANASGKTNLISAMSFAQKLVTRGFPKNAACKYCKVDPENKNNSSYFEFEIVINGRYYSYGFEVILSKQSITSEWLYEVSPLGHDKEIFSRDVLKGEYSVSKYFSDKELIKKLDVYADDIKSDGSILFLRILNKNKTTLYAESEESRILHSVFNWFLTYLSINFSDSPISNYSYFVSSHNIETISELLSAFGTGITKYSIVSTSIEKTSNEIPQEIIDEILKELNNKKPKDDSDDEHVVIGLRDRKSLYIFEVDEDGNISCKTIQFNHGNNDIFFDMAEESDGTTRLLDLLTVLLDERQGSVYVIDEIDRSLHPQLTYKFIYEYLKLATRKEMQLIITTHESRLLDFDLLRKDEIWFVNKNSRGQSAVYSLDEYNERFDKKIDKAYLEGRYGGVPIFSTVFPVDGE